MSYIVPSPTYWNPGPVAYHDEPQAPVPGWGMRRGMTGPRMVGVGGLGASPDDVVIDLGPALSQPLAWLIRNNETVAQLRGLTDGGSVALDYEALYGESEGNMLPFLRLALDLWAHNEGLAYAAGDHARAAGYAYAQALLWRAFSVKYSGESMAVFPDAAKNAGIAKRRGLDHWNQAKAVAGGHVYKAGAATATIASKPAAAWSLAPKPKPVAPKPADQIELEPAPKNKTGLYVAAGVAVAVAVGAGAWYWMTKR